MNWSHKSHIPKGFEIMRLTFDSKSHGLNSLIIDFETMRLVRMLTGFFSCYVLNRPKDVTKKPVVLLLSVAA